MNAQRLQYDGYDRLERYWQWQCVSIIPTEGCVCVCVCACVCMCVIYHFGDMQRFPVNKSPSISHRLPAAIGHWEVTVSSHTLLASSNIKLTMHTNHGTYTS